MFSEWVARGLRPHAKRIERARAEAQDRWLDEAREKQALYSSVPHFEENLSNAR